MKAILDACCGSRMFWFDRRHPDVVFMDRREETHTLCDGRTLEIKPDVVGDFRAMPFSDGAFRLVVFDPPHPMPMQRGHRPSPLLKEKKPGFMPRARAVSVSAKRERISSKTPA